MALSLAGSRYHHVQQIRNIGLDENFIYFRPGSDAALAAAFTSAIDKGQAIVDITGNNLAHGTLRPRLTRDAPISMKKAIWQKNRMPCCRLYHSGKQCLYEKIQPFVTNLLQTTKPAAPLFLKHLPT